MDKRTYTFFSMSFLDILLGFLGAITFLFITAVRGGGTPVENEMGHPIVYLTADTTQGIFYGLEQFDTLNLANTGSVLVVVDDFADFDVPPCPVCPSCDELDGEVCPNPAHHKMRPCPNPKDHLKQPKKRIESPIACTKKHCNHKEPMKPIIKEVVKTVFVEPIELPYKIAFSILDISGESNDRDVDLQICKRKVCINSSSGKKGEIRWVDLNKSGWFKKGLNAGGELIISDLLQSGTYQVFARYDKNTSRSASTKSRISIATKHKGVTNYKAKEVRLKATDDYQQVAEVQISANGVIRIK